MNRCKNPSDQPQSMISGVQIILGTKFLYLGVICGYPPLCIHIRPNPYIFVIRRWSTGWWPSVLGPSLCHNAPWPQISSIVHGVVSKYLCMTFFKSSLYIERYTWIIKSICIVNKSSTIEPTITSQTFTTDVVHRALYPQRIELHWSSAVNRKLVSNIHIEWNNIHTS